MKRGGTHAWNPKFITHEENNHKCPGGKNCKCNNLENEINPIEINSSTTLTEWEIDEELRNELSEIKTYPDILHRQLPENIKNLIQDLEFKGVIGENPKIFQSRNPFRCKLEILNPDLKIKTAEIKAGNLELIEYEMHIKELLELGVIRKSNSPHRSAAFIVNKHSEQVRGKSRMVINYKRLNDNTLDNSYKLPGKDQLINRIQDAKIFSKIDLKSGFWQIQMENSSIIWTAFTVPMGHYEWTVMPFGLKNAPAVFQQMMDTIFKKYYKFVAVYIDDILIFSKNKKDHEEHISMVFIELEKNGLVASKKKIHLLKYNIEF